MNESSRKTVRGEVLKLIEQKEQLENEIKEVQNILTKVFYSINTTYSYICK